VGGAILDGIVQQDGDQLYESPLLSVDLVVTSLELNGDMASGCMAGHPILGLTYDITYAVALEACNLILGILLSKL
jgi:hypothetical protein